MIGLTAAAAAVVAEAEVLHVWVAAAVLAVAQAAVDQTERIHHFSDRTQCISVL